MAYFNHAFCKSWLAEGATPADTTATSAFTAGQMAIVDGTTWLADDIATISNAGHLAYLVGGNFHTQDNIGNNPGHGGYRESIKSKGINLRYLSRLGIADSAAATNATAEICVAADCAPCGQNLFVRIDVKGSPALRFLNHNAYAIGDSSGDAHANGGPLPGLCCATGQEFLDPAMALAASIQMLLADPIINPFIAEQQSGTTLHGITITNTAGGLDGVDTFTDNNDGAGYAVGDLILLGGAGTGAVFEVATIGGGGSVDSVTLVAAGSNYAIAAGIATTVLTGGGDGIATLDVTAVTANSGTFSITDVLNTPAVYTSSVDPVADGVAVCATVIGAYVSTHFGDCSFDTRDHYEKEPVQIIASILDETGDPCNDCGVLTTTPGTQSQTLGENVLRRLLLTERYLQNPYSQGAADSARIREIEGFDPIVSAVNRQGLYRVYYLQHSVPRFNNPSGVFDNDQYLYEIFVASDDAVGIADMDTLWNEIEAQAAALSNPVVIDSGL